METLLLYMLLTAAMYYLAARAVITQWLWSRYPPKLDYYLTCAACSGLLYGVVVALVIGLPLDLPLLGLPGRHWLTPIVAGLGSMIWTPIVAYLQVGSLQQLGVVDPRQAVDVQED